MSLPKNGKAQQVDMSQQLGWVLERLRSLQEADAALAGTPPPERVFSNFVDLAAPVSDLAL